MEVTLEYGEFIDHLDLSNAPVLYWKCNTQTPYTFVTQFGCVLFKFTTANTTERDYIKSNYKITQLNTDT